ncbi:MAG: EAL domain-containing protein [Alphaproteobacteria bacterium]|nr:EAL domain-containing protein [Alphaproteobacteria bacterium]
MTVDSNRDRFVKLAFCRADLLFELDGDRRVVFAAGATEVVCGRPPEALKGTAFDLLVADADRLATNLALTSAGPVGRIEERCVHVGRAALAMTMAGYRAADFGGHFFLALKAEPTQGVPMMSGDGPEPEIVEKGAFAEMAAQRAAEFKRGGGRAQITLFKVENLDGMMKQLGASAKKRLLAAIDVVLKERALGGDCAGHVDGESFCLVHDEAVDPREVGEAIEKTAGAHAPAGVQVKAEAATLDADGAGLSEDQVAKAFIHTIQRFCAEGAAGVKSNLDQVLSQMMADTVESVATIRQIARNVELDLVFMPICDLRLGKVHHFEMLTRFRDPRFKASPFQLITLAEEVDIIHDLDMAIVKKAVKLLGDLSRKDPIPPVAVNLSGKSVMSPSFIDELHNFLRNSGVNPHKLMFEITESARVDRLDVVNAHMQTFREKGFKFALDDFGAGSASFDYLNVLDADYVKFDGPVVRRACGSNKGNAMLSTMAKMCSGHRMFTVAEMVEDKKMADQVYHCGIDYGQGWHFGKPSDDPYVFADRFVARVKSNT